MCVHSLFSVCKKMGGVKRRGLGVVSLNFLTFAFNR